jgi:hypothetical protein
MSQQQSTLGQAYTTTVPGYSYEQAYSTTTTTFPTITTESFPITTRIITATVPVEVQETETATVFGQTGVILNRDEIATWKGTLPISSYPINEDTNPEIITKRTEQCIHLPQEIAVRYLCPPTPLPPGEIIIKEENAVSIPPAPPLVIRQQPPRPETPAPIVIREVPPKTLPVIGQKVISISGKRMPPPPRKVIIERLPPIPAPPPSVLVERWLAHQQRGRRVVFQRAAVQAEILPKPKNMIIQWEAPCVEIRKEIKDLGVARANPVEYEERYGSILKQYVDFPLFVKDIRPPAGLILASEAVQVLPNLEGDIQALTLIDLDREGLAEYRNVVEQFRVRAV